MIIICFYKYLAAPGNDIMRSIKSSAFGASMQLGLTQSVLLASLPMLVVNTGVSYQQWSWFLGGTLLLYMVSAPWWGQRIDRQGPHASLRQTTAGTLACNLLLCIGLFVPQPLVASGIILLSRVGYALFASGQYPSSQAVVMAGASQQSRQLALGRLLAANHSGRLIGPALVAIAAPFWYPLPIVLLVLLCLLIFWSCPGKDATGAAATAPAENDLSQDQPGLQHIWPALTAAFLVTLAVSTLQFTLSFSLGEHFSLSPEKASQLLSVTLLTATVAGLISHLGLLPLLNTRPALHLVTLVLGLLGGSALLLLPFSQLQLLTAIALLTSGFSLASPAYTHWAHQRFPSRVGRTTSTLTSIHTLGHAAGTVLAGSLGLAYVHAIYAGLFVVVLAAGGVMALVLLENRYGGMGEVIAERG